MVKLSRNQAATLLKLIVFANQHGGRLPTGREFAEILQIGERGALARIRRIVERNDSFYKDGRAYYVDYDQLVTEKESAQLCLTIHKISEISQQGRVTKTQLLNEIKFNQQNLDITINKLCKAGYLYAISSAVEALRAGPKIFNQLEYLERLAAQ